MFKSNLLKSKFSQVSAKTLSLAGKDYMLGRNERKIKYSEAFEYDSLSGPRCFRLLRIQPGADTEVLSVHLFETSLDDQLEFEALSYAWNLDPKISFTQGDLVEDQKREERPVLCNGKTLHITMNLYNALIEFRTLNLSKPLWADQVCINQQDGQEKIAQLAIMTQIYTCASAVIIWLGELSRSKNWALDFMQSLPDQPLGKGAEDELQPRLGPGIQRTDTLLDKFNSPFGAIAAISGSTMQNARWLATMLVLGGQWFQRIWTLQEFMLAKRFRFMMGHREIPSSSFIKASTQLAAFFAADTLAIHFGFNLAFSDLALRQDLFDERDRYQGGKRYNAEEYFSEAKTRSATVPKDFVFAGAALLEKGIPKSIDYASTTSDIYCAFASERLWPEIGVRALALVGGVLPTVEGLPSWCADLSTSLHPTTLQDCMAQTFPVPIALARDEHRIDGRILHLNAAKWDVVTKIGESMWSWQDWSTAEEFAYNCSAQLKMTTSTTAAQERFGLMFGLLDDIGQAYGPTGEPSISALWKTLLGGVTLVENERDSVWQGRFFYFFAFLYLMMRADLKEKREEPSSKQKSWMVALIQDLPRMEQRVSHFLENYDIPAGGDGEGAHPHSLREVITDLGNRIWGGQERQGKGTTLGAWRELMAIGRGDDFYQPVSLFGQKFKAVYAGRRIFVTEKGYLGLGSEATKAGDAICLIAGASAPYLLRPVQSKEAVFTLVSEAYVHGLIGMDKFDEAELAFEPVQIV